MDQGLILHDNARPWGGMFSLIRPTISILHPPTATILAPWRTHSKHAVLRMTTSWDTARVMSSDASAKGFTRPAYSVSPKAEKVCFKWMGLYGNNLNFINNIPMVYKLHRYYSLLQFLRKKYGALFRTAFRRMRRLINCEWCGSKLKIVTGQDALRTPLKCNNPEW